MATKVKVRRSRRMRIRRTVLSSRHLRRVGRIIAKSIKRNVRAGVTPDGAPLPPDLSGDGRPLRETGKMLKSVKGRVRRGVLQVGPDYNKYPYAIFLQRGYDTRASDAQAPGKVQENIRIAITSTGRARRNASARALYWSSRAGKVKRHGKQPARPFVAMSRRTLDEVVESNEREFEAFVDDLGGKAAAIDAFGISAIVGAAGAIR